MGHSTKLKLTLVALAIMIAAAVAFYLLRIKDSTLWIAWMGTVMGLVTQYSVANAAITSKALSNGGSHASSPVG